MPADICNSAAVSVCDLFREQAQGVSPVIVGERFENLI
jgi:hypothetical protein